MLTKDETISVLIRCTSPGRDEVVCAGCPFEHSDNCAQELKENAIYWMNQ